MKAIVQDRYGPSSVLRMADMPVPEIAADEVLVAVHAASMHADIWHAVTGVPYALRLMGSGVRRPKQPIPGIDVSGTIVAVGSEVTAFAPGNEVFGETTRRQQWTNGGAFAEFAAVPAAALAIKPTRLSHVEAAAVPTSGLIGVQVVEDEGRVQPRQTVLVNGAAGGVGVFAVQVAKAAGAFVTGVDRTDKLEILHRIGADEVVDYTTTDVTERLDAYDVFIDVAGTEPPRRARRAVRPDGAYVLVGHDQYGASRKPLVGSISTFVGMMAVSPFVSQYHVRGPRARSSRMQRLVELIETDQLSPVIDTVFPLERVREALDRLTSGTVAGKIVIEVTPPG
jgi:NADPH:quinone reductase-like Zn-dependent oxidoreductase